MARQASEGAKTKTRLNLELPERIRVRLEDLRTMSESDSLTEVIRRALALYDVVLTSTKRDGQKIFLRDKDGTEREIFVI
jgi:hypothetical protein